MSMDDELERRISIAAVLIGYPREAVLFVLSAWSDYEVYSNAQIDGETVCWRLHDLALNIFGTDAREQLEQWKITTTEDFGNIVFGLIDHGFMTISETDKLKDFTGVFEFEEQFVNPRYDSGKSSSQLSLLALFVVTTVAAIAVSGFSRGGVIGVYYAFAASWFSILGLSCVVMGISNRNRGWQFQLGFGIACLAAGIFLFYTIPFL